MTYQKTDNTILLQPFPAAAREQLWAFLQNYLRELSAYYDLEKDDAGRYRYRWFDSYFEENEREALRICSDDQTVGFALLNAHSCLGAQIDHAVAEFTIFPAYRKAGCGIKAMRQIFAERPGVWEIKYSLKNTAAETFWKHVTQPYAPQLTRLDDEAVLRLTV